MEWHISVDHSFFMLCLEFNFQSNRLVNLSYLWYNLVVLKKSVLPYVPNTDVVYLSSNEIFESNTPVIKTREYISKKKYRFKTNYYFLYHDNSIKSACKNIFFIQILYVFFFKHIQYLWSFDGVYYRSIIISIVHIKKMF